MEMSSFVYEGFLYENFMCRSVSYEKIEETTEQICYEQYADTPPWAHRCGSASRADCLPYVYLNINANLQCVKPHAHVREIVASCRFRLHPQLRISADLEGRIGWFQ